MQGSHNFNEGPPRRLYRSKINRMISGVCGGLAEYMNIDPVIVRISFILLGLFGGVGLLLYILGMIIIPQNPTQYPLDKVKEKTDHSAFWGWFLIIIGALLLIPQFTFIPPIDFWNLPWTSIWAVLFIAFGIFLILKKSETAPKIEGEKPAGSEPKEEPKYESAAKPKILYRSKKERMISGVCGGLAEYFNMDPTVVRLIFVILTLFSKGLGVIAYIILILAVPQEKPQIFSNGEKS